MNVPVPNTNEATNCVTFTTEQTGQAWGGIQPPQPQHVCPACGHCPCCGRGGYQFQPWPGYPNPYIGDPIPYPWGGPWYGTNTTTAPNTNMLYTVWN